MSDLADDLPSDLGGPFDLGDPGDSNTQKVIRVLLTPAAELEAAMQAVLRQRTVDTAVGVQLTALGKLVGRTGRHPDDEIERRFVRAQIAANKSDGTVEDKLTVAKLVVNDPAATFVVNQTGIAASIWSVEGIALPDDVAQVLVALLLKATSAGVRTIVEWSPADPDDVMFWDLDEWDTHVWGSAADKEF